MEKKKARNLYISAPTGLTPHIGCFDLNVDISGAIVVRVTSVLPAGPLLEAELDKLDAGVEDLKVLLAVLDSGSARVQRCKDCQENNQHIVQETVTHARCLLIEVDRMYVPEDANNTVSTREL